MGYLNFLKCIKDICRLFIKKVYYAKNQTTFSYLYLKLYSHLNVNKIVKILPAKMK